MQLTRHAIERWRQRIDDGHSPGEIQQIVMTAKPAGKRLAKKMIEAFPRMQEDLASGAEIFVVGEAVLLVRVDPDGTKKVVTVIDRKMVQEVMANMRGGRDSNTKRAQGRGKANYRSHERKKHLCEFRTKRPK